MNKPDKKELARRAYVAPIDTRASALIAVARAHFERVIAGARQS